MTTVAPDIEKRFDKIDMQLVDMNKQLDKIVTVVVKGFDRIDKTLEEKASNADMQRVLGLLDELAKRVEISDDERLVMGHQLERLDRWTHELAQKIGYELST
jgi:hypothetical protein